MFKGLKFIGIIMQVLGVLIPILGIALGLIGISASETFRQNETLAPYALSIAAAQAQAFTFAVAGFFVGVIAYAVGGLIRAQVSVARDARRTADAIEWLARRQRPQS